MQTVFYDGSFEGWLCAVFDVYYYKFNDVIICPEQKSQTNLFNEAHFVVNKKEHSQRVWEGLQKKLTPEALQQVYKTFLSELPDIENTLLQYVQYVLSSDVRIEMDFAHPAVLAVHQTAKKVWKEQHRMEAFVRFQQTKDQLFYAIIEPDYNVLPLISTHFKNRYADQHWLIFDARRKYGIYYDLHEVAEVKMNFSEGTNNGADASLFYDEEESIYQQLWQQYFKAVNIPARKNTKLHIQHMPARYWKYLPEKKLFKPDEGAINAKFNRQS